MELQPRRMVWCLRQRLLTEGFGFMTGILETLELREGGSIRQQREISRKLKAAEKRSQRQSRTTEKPKGETEEPK